MGHDMKDVEAVILTHAHADHMGFADRVARSAKAPVYIHANDVSASRRVLQLPWPALLSNAWRPFMASVLAKAIANGVFSTAHISKPQPLADGAVLQVPGRPHVIHTPGHTAGEVAYYLPEHHVLISGDSLVTQDLYSGKSGQPQLTRPGLNDDYGRARQSLHRLHDVGRVKVLPGHGSSWEGEIREAISLALA